ncbi:MAG TPA: inorganic phosphate transporter [Candidatus Desulfofervidus auxilii]|uniref:Phosphate transporter n=1 Tax=Desulfofervidus auxilii TaxID=1621989 RepID=A0A7V0NEW7_DESA2|nr:inorganic phosphate transporter [Candidatus Desulfofervidus auxilii]
MEHYLFFLIGGFFLGFAMAWNLGANDVANSMASAVGAHAITIRQATIIASLLTFVGATFIGGHVAETIRKGIIPFEAFSAQPDLIIIGSFSALFSASLWVFVATWLEMPVSSTHSIVGSLLGVGIVAGGFKAINWAKVTNIIASWVISPFFSGLLGFILFLVIRKTILEKETLEKIFQIGPIFVGLAMFVVSMSFLLKTPLGERIHLALIPCCIISAFIAFISILVGRGLIYQWLKEKTDEPAEMVFRKLQIFTSCYVALSQGANDVANAVGPLAVIYMFITTGHVHAKVPVPTHLLAYGGLGIAVGIITFGHKVIKTVGFRITELTNTRGFSIDMGTATTILLASKLGLPVSTTHAAVGAVIGIGLARGFEAVDMKIILKIIIYWLITLPIVASTGMLLFKVLLYIFG